MTQSQYSDSLRGVGWGGMGWKVGEFQEGGGIEYTYG